MGWFVDALTGSLSAALNRNGDTMHGDLTMGTHKIFLGTGTAFIGSTADPRLLFDGGSQTYQWDHVLELFWNHTNPDISLFSASDNRLDILNGGGGKANFNTQNQLTFGYGDYLGVSPTSNWSSGTHKLIETGWDGSTDFIKIYTPGNTTPNPIISAGANGTLGFYNHTRTAQQVLATGASHTVDDVITALQNLGLVKQF